MDESNFVDIKRMVSKEQVAKVHQFIEYIEDEILIPQAQLVSNSAKILSF